MAPQADNPSSGEYGPGRIEVREAAPISWVLFP